MLAYWPTVRLPFLYLYSAHPDLPEDQCELLLSSGAGKAFLWLWRIQGHPEGHNEGHIGGHIEGHPEGHNEGHIGGHI